MTKPKVSLVDYLDVLWAGEDYRLVIRAWIEQQPHGGRGSALKLANAAKIQAGLMSKVMKGDRELTFEQGYSMAMVLGLDRPSTDQFMDLISLSRAGFKTAYGLHLFDRMSRRRKARSEKYRVRLEPDEIERARLQLEEKVYYFSNWHPAVICQVARLPGLNTVERIAAELQLDATVVAEHVSKLVKMGLLSLEPDQTLRFLIEADFESGEFSHQTLRNYRLFSMDRIDRKNAKNWWSFGGIDIYTHAEAQKIKTELMALMREVIYQRVALAQNVEGEVAYCLNLDWIPVAQVSK